eukprot:comp11454_c0_seq1/m.5886 comp11454_c0_seq1/g.5886  ORF comp11454_c0_seq1/g.5886 comp11454_c0_seq1/m.5886 type:complete len:432 (-) comp11454_c0_seq1:415-1710(-)
MGRAPQLETAIELKSTTSLVDDDKNISKITEDCASISSSEPLGKFLFQIWPPLIIAGFGSVITGVLLNQFQTWEVFARLPQLFILVPPLLDLKGDLEMTLNSRLSTEANKGTLKSLASCKAYILANLALTQIQAIVVSFVAALYAIILGETTGLPCSLSQALLLTATSLTTATLAAGILGVVMCGVIIFSSQRGFNPDNFANSVTASLGDVLTLVILSMCGAFLLSIEDVAPVVLPVLLVGQIMLIPTWIRLCSIHKAVKQVLRNGWVPILTAMIISGAAGLTLEEEIEAFPKMALLVPIVNGVGGNIGAVLASRAATSFHVHGKPDGYYPSIVLFLLTIPTHLILIAGVEWSSPDTEFLNDAGFLGSYLCASVGQVACVVVLVHVLSRKVWAAGLDPDNWVIPYVTACADFLGTGMLAYSFLRTQAPEHV